jgi:predicted small integral membrane protein
LCELHSLFHVEATWRCSEIRNLGDAEVSPMVTRSAKLLLLAGIAFYYTLVVFNNLTDFNSNYEFIRHVLSMDSTFPGNHAMWRAVPWPLVHLVFYWMIIGWEFVTGLLAWWGVVCLARAFRRRAIDFNIHKRVALAALTLSLLMWLVAFLDVGGEWFLMWQSRIWNGQAEAFRMFVIVGFVLLLLLQPDTDTQP